MPRANRRRSLALSLNEISWRMLENDMMEAIRSLRERESRDCCEEAELKFTSCRCPVFCRVAAAGICWVRSSLASLYFPRRRCRAVHCLAPPKCTARDRGCGISNFQLGGCLSFTFSAVNISSIFSYRKVSISGPEPYYTILRWAIDLVKQKSFQLQMFHPMARPDEGQSGRTGLGGWNTLSKKTVW